MEQSGIKQVGNMRMFLSGFLRLSEFGSSGAVCPSLWHTSIPGQHQMCQGLHPRAWEG